MNKTAEGRCIRKRDRDRINKTIWADFKYYGGVHMTVDTKTMVSITEANQNFSKVARLVDELGSVVILKNNAPRYLVIDFSKVDESAVAKDEDVLEISKRLLAQNKEAYEVLAK